MSGYQTLGSRGCQRDRQGDKGPKGRSPRLENNVLVIQQATRSLHRFAPTSERIALHSIAPIQEGRAE